MTPTILSNIEEYLFNDGVRLKSHNTIVGIMKRFRAFLHWAMLPQNGNILQQNSFSQFQLKGEVYGALICMTKEERNYLFEKEINN